MFMQGSRMRHSARVGLILAILAATCALAAKKPTEYDVKAAYLVNFGRFMRGGPGAAPRASDFDICVLGEDPMGSSLDVIAENEKIGPRTVRVKRVHDAREARPCDIVYLSAAEGEKIAADLEVLRGADALTVSDAPEFLRNGGMIQFVLQGDHVRFSVNLGAVHKAHVVLSSELLRVALSVVGAPAGEVAP